ncbi:Nudix hydrolase 7 [Linum perenne]
MGKESWLRLFPSPGELWRGVVDSETQSTGSCQPVLFEEVRGLLANDYSFVKIDVEFVEILAFRTITICFFHAQAKPRSFFSKSDLFFACMMRPLSSIMITTQASEIEASEWIPIEEYVEQQFNKKHGQFGYVAEICKTKAEGGGYAGFSAVPLSTSSGKVVYLYYNNQG